MTLVEIGNQILVIAKDGAHILDISDIAKHDVNRESIQAALKVFFEKSGTRLATPEEMERRGFKSSEPRLDRVRPGRTR